MYSIKIAGSFIDLFPGTAITVEIPNTVFLGGDLSRYLQPHTLPVDIPATTRNISIVGAAHVVQARGVLYREIDCELWLYGSIWRTGKAYIQEATDRRYRMSMVFNPYRNLANLRLPDLDLGGERTLGSGLTGPGSVQEGMGATATDPEDYDFTFIPASNYQKFDDMDTNEPGESNPAEAWWQNKYNAGDEVYEDFNDSLLGGHAPNVKVQYLLEQLFSEMGYDFTNNFQTDTELKRLYHYSNNLIQDQDGAVTEKIWLNAHVPDVKAHDYLRGLMNMFSLTFAEDPIEPHITLHSNNYIMALPPLYNWSNKLHQGMIVSQQFDYPGVFGFSSPIRWEGERFDAARRNVQRYTYAGEVDEQADIPTGVGETEITLYYVRSREAYMIRVPGEEFPKDYYLETETYTYDANRDTLDSALGTTIMIPPQEMEVKDGGGSVLARRYTPYVEQPMTIRQLDQQYDVPNMLIFYRGMYQDPYLTAKTRPTGSTSVYDWDEARIWNYSLQWRGDYGLFNVWWKPWTDMLINSRQVECMLQLSEMDLRHLQIWRKALINGTSYFIKSLTVTVTPSGIRPTKAVLLSADW